MTEESPNIGQEDLESFANGLPREVIFPVSGNRRLNLLSSGVPIGLKR